MRRRMRSANNTSIFCGSMIAVTSPSPNIGCMSVCPLRYVLVRSYGAPTVEDARRVVPARYATRDAHIGQLTRVMLPVLLTETTTCPRSSLQVMHIWSTRSPILKTIFSSMISPVSHQKDCGSGTDDLSHQLCYSPAIA